ncbi:zinc finger and SCAN domain-containing protein 21-like isoform X3 [Periophthalmus magnuspinnatus]|uniref:zinc finger and SCAN domain-containing protein 21-like isoform X3 n=1 Tax=Periophthalmus magnuspinnatus TaxID=409849 RepID=UPI002436AB87|nr:zinc finger and SCAN domain-containing protein 21-like isoform X3 [Periophthalmus magnuspinnatus]
MEIAKSVFHAKLASVMDTLLANAVREIVKIFESSLSQHQAELLQKTNEITILREELEKVQRKCAEKSTNTNISDADEPISERGLCVKQEPNTVDVSDEEKALRLNLSGIKKESQEFPDFEADESKLEHNGSPRQASATIQEIQLNQQINLFPPAQCKDEMPDWDESIHTAAQLNAEEALSPSLLSILPKVCSNTSQTEGWVPGLSAAQDSTMENFKGNETNCPGPVNRNTVFGVGETCLEDNYVTFLEEDPGNLTSSHQIAQSAQRLEGGLTPYTKRGSTFVSRDQPQSNFPTLTLRNMESLTHRPSASGVNRRPYSCPYCGKSFTHPSHHRQHLLCHTGVRLPLCQFCEKRFLTPSELTTHTCTYSGERPFGCSQCGRRFARSRNLRAHQRDVHLGKRPFACTECGQRFAHKGNLRVHKHRVHNGLHLQQTQ